MADQKQKYTVNATFIKVAQAPDRLMIKYNSDAVKKEIWGRTFKNVKDFCGGKYKTGDRVVVTYNQDGDTMPFIFRIDSLGGATTPQQASPQAAQQQQAAPQQATAQPTPAPSTPAPAPVAPAPVAPVATTYLGKDEQILRESALKSATQALIAQQGFVNPNNVITELRKLYKESYALLRAQRVEDIQI